MVYLLYIYIYLKLHLLLIHNEIQIFFQDAMFFEKQANRETDRPGMF